LGFRCEELAAPVEGEADGLWMNSGLCFVSSDTLLSQQFCWWWVFTLALRKGWRDEGPVAPDG